MFVMKLKGGPFVGVRYCERLEDYSLSWPLPDELPGTEQWGGMYVKVSESKLTAEDAKHPNLSVGAVFEWREDDH